MWTRSRRHGFEARRHRRLHHAHRRPESSRSNVTGARFEWRPEAVVGLPAAGWQSLLGFGPVCSRGRDDESVSGARNAVPVGCDGSGVLFGTGFIEVVKTDVLIIGGGPAGLAAAIAARMKGFAVTV